MIKPLRCELALELMNVDMCLPATSLSNVTVYNKKREKFRIGVGLSVTLEHIVIDSIDSILQTQVLGTPKVACLNEYR